MLANAINTSGIIRSAGTGLKEAFVWLCPEFIICRNYRFKDDTKGYHSSEIKERLTPI